MKNITTTSIADFGYRERELILDILKAWQEQGLPEGFCDEQVVFMMNKDSGNVFLTNEEYQTAMMNGDKLEIWHSCFNCGHEGFEEDCQLNDSGCNACFPKDEAKEMRRTCAIANRKSIEEHDDYPTVSICVTREEWERCKFLCMQLDSQDPTVFIETDHPDGYNMILLHPETHELFWGYSADFEFEGQ